MTNKNEIVQNDAVQDEVLQDEILDVVSGGSIIGVPKSGENTAIVRAQKHIDTAWEIIKTRQEWKFKDREMELQAKKMWMDAAFNLPDAIGKIVGLFKGGA